MIYLIGFFFVMYLAQLFLTSIQMKHISAKYLEYTRKYQGSEYFIGISKKRKFKSGPIIMIVCDENLKVIDLEVMKGISVFSRFRKMDIDENFLTQLDNKKFYARIFTESGYRSLVDIVENIKLKIKERREYNESYS